MTFEYGKEKAQVRTPPPPPAVMTKLSYSTRYQMGGFSPTPDENFSLS